MFRHVDRLATADSGQHLTHVVPQIPKTDRVRIGHHETKVPQNCWPESPVPGRASDSALAETVSWFRLSDASASRPGCVRQDEGVARIRAQASSGKPTTLREFLLRQDPAWLADELLRIAEADPLVAARLKAAAGADRAGLVDLSRLRRELDTAILPGGFIEYGAAWGYARGIDSALDQVEELTRKGFPDAGIEASEHALSLLEEAFDQVDDSDGELGGIRGRAQEIHLAACEAARPDPVQLGERLARWALRSGWEIFLEAPSAYADVLGAEGLARFEAIVDEQFRTAPAGPWR